MNTETDEQLPDPPAAQNAGEPEIPHAERVAQENVTAEPVLARRTLSIPTRTLPLLAAMIAIGASILTFTFRTVHLESALDLATIPNAVRTNFSVRYWLENGYFSNGGLAVRPSSPTEVHYYVTSGGGQLVSGFVATKIHHTITGRQSPLLLAVHNQVVTMLAAALLGLLAFRLARRVGASPPHALILAGCVEVLHFTFPDNLAAYWEMTGRPWFFLFAACFLLIEERAQDGRTKTMTLAQAISVFLMAYLELVATSMFLVAYIVVALAVKHPIPVKRAIAVVIVPAALAFGVFRMQLRWVDVRHPEIPKTSSTFLFRSGLDGSAQYYGDHLDIANRRDVARRDFKYNRQYLFRWKWLFVAGTAALIFVLIFAATGRVPVIATLSLLSMTGTYTLYAGVFSQGMVIHPYLFDVLLVTPLLLALFCVAPAILESLTNHRGIVVATVFFLAVWVTFVQLRRYALWYPPQSTVEKTQPKP